MSTLAVAGFIGCNSEGARFSARDATTLTVSLDTARGTKQATVVLAGLSGVELATLRKAHGDSAVRALLHVAVAGHDDIAIGGNYTITDSTAQFTPQFPFDAGRSYAVRVNARSLTPPRADSVATFIVALPRGNQIASTVVTRIMPSSDVLPENLLRFYIEFSKPMSRTGGLEYMNLFDEGGREIVHAFLPLDADFWNEDRTRYTAFLDPGRVKRGILPNEQLGRAILNGHRYTLVIDSSWHDADGLPLAATYRREFRVGAPDESTIDLKAWKSSAPKAGSMDTLSVTFPKPLDFGLLHRAVGVETRAGSSFLGTIRVAKNELEWRFVPNEAWKLGDYRLVVFSSLEDAAGNRIDRPFEVDMFERVDKDSAPQRYFVPFTVRQ